MSPDMGTWQTQLARVRLFAGLTGSEQLRLRQLAECFLHEKHIELVGGLTLDGDQRLLLAGLACLPVLELGLDAYDNWQTLIVYPRRFIPGQSEVDAVGVVHPPQPRVGEAWPGGPVILSWKDLERDLKGDWDYPMNVIIHEMCHQLDGRSGGFDGMPPLPHGIERRVWIREFTAAFLALRARLDQGLEPGWDPYAAEAPAEFFAVAGECFFVAPDRLLGGHPRIYQLLKEYFRQDPYQRIGQGRVRG